MNIEPVKDGDAGGLVLMDDGGNLGVFVQDGGNVGIGTASPSALLDVASLEKRVAMLEARVAALEGHAHDTERMRGSRN